MKGIQCFPRWQDFDENGNWSASCLPEAHLSFDPDNISPHPNNPQTLPSYHRHLFVFLLYFFNQQKHPSTVVYTRCHTSVLSCITIVLPHHRRSPQQKDTGRIRQIGGHFLHQPSALKPTLMKRCHFVKRRGYSRRTPLAPVILPMCHSGPR